MGFEVVTAVTMETIRLYISKYELKVNDDGN
jgi:hypothetical protein